MTRIVTDVEALRLPCLPVESLREGAAVARKLGEALDGHNRRAVRHNRKGVVPALPAGVGLAANQIGLRKQVCLLRPGAKPWVLMNPVLVDHSRTKVPFTEGCLSLPGQTFETWRYVWATFDTLNLGRVTFGPEGTEWRAGDLLHSFVAQHEYWHLQGKLPADFTEKDYPSPLGESGVGTDADVDNLRRAGL